MNSEILLRIWSQKLTEVSEPPSNEAYIKVTEASNMQPIEEITSLKPNWFNTLVTEICKIRYRDRYKRLNLSQNRKIWFRSRLCHRWIIDWLKSWFIMPWTEISPIIRRDKYRAVDNQVDGQLCLPYEESSRFLKRSHR